MAGVKKTVNETTMAYTFHSSREAAELWAEKARKEDREHAYKVVELVKWNPISEVIYTDEMKAADDNLDALMQHFK